jgi:hypothetical protein
MTDTPQRYVIDEVENYPVYYLKPIAPGAPAGAGHLVEPALVARYEAALTEWDAVQSALGDILEPDE